MPSSIVVFRPLLILVLVAGSAWSMSGPAPAPSWSRARDLASDTLLTDSIRTGAVFIRALPGSLAGRAVESYEGVRVPATGWIQDRSFFWRVPTGASGTHRFVLVARLAGGSRDTVHVDLHVRD